MKFAKRSSAQFAREVTSALATMGVAFSALVLSGCGSTARPASTENQSVEETLYQRLGGIDVLRQLVDAWILEVASDPRIRDFFADADIARVKLRLVERLCVLVDGPCLYRGGELREHHAELGIEEHHMRAFIADLEPAMKRVKIVGDAARELREAMQVLGAQVGSGLSD